MDQIENVIKYYYLSCVSNAKVIPLVGQTQNQDTCFHSHQANEELFRKLKKTYIFSMIFLLAGYSLCGQSKAYQKKKEEKIQKGSVFTKIVNRELPATIVYEDDDIISFKPLRLQAPVHLLIVPKKEIYTVNEISDNDLMLIGKMFMVARKLAKENDVHETGYRLSVNTNEDAGQSVFHLHMHLLGGEELGPMLTQKE